MKLLVTAWPKIDGFKRQPGDEVDVADEALARMLIRDGQCRPAGSPEPLAVGGGSGAPTADPPAQTPADAAGTPPPRPGRGASKEELAAYAISQGLDEAAAADMSRAQLTAHVART